MMINDDEWQATITATTPEEKKTVQELEKPNAPQSTVFIDDVRKFYCCVYNISIGILLPYT